MQLHLSYFISLTVGKLLRIPLAVLAASLLARAVGPEGVGQWAMLLAVTTMLHSFLLSWTQAYNVRFGREEWLQPYIDELIIDLAKRGTKKIQIISPGFSVDCLETLEEINIQYRNLFMNNGGEEFEYIPCLNDGETHINLIKTIIDQNIKDW